METVLVALLLGWFGGLWFEFGSTPPRHDFGFAGGFGHRSRRIPADLAKSCLVFVGGAGFCTDTLRLGLVALFSFEKATANSRGKEGRGKRGEGRGLIAGIHSHPRRSASRGRDS